LKKEIKGGALQLQGTVHFHSYSINVLLCGTQKEISRKISKLLFSIIMNGDQKRYLSKMSKKRKNIISSYVSENVFMFDDRSFIYE